MITDLWPILFPIIGFVLIGSFVTLGYVFKFKVGAVLGVVLALLPIIPFYLAVKDGMGMILIYGLVALLPMALACVALLAFAGSQLKDKKPKIAWRIIGGMSILWIAFVLLGMFGDKVLA